MTVLQTLVVTIWCDYGDCNASVESHGLSYMKSMSEARADGWHITATTQFCPAHSTSPSPIR